MSPPVVFLHIGAPKTGTTYLQTLFDDNRDRLAADGILWPGRDWDEQVLAVRDLIQAHPHGHIPAEIDGAWARLLSEIHEWKGRAALISMEWLVSAGPPYIRRAVDSLAPAKVHVVITLRDIARALPAQWQESVRNAETWSWSEYLAGVMDPDAVSTGPGKDFWEQHDVGTFLRSWGEAVPAERIHVVTVPPPGTDADLLWRRFATVLGVDSARYALPGDRSHPSLGSVSSELMRRLNAATRSGGLRWPAYEELLKYGLAMDVLAGRRAVEPPLRLPASALPWAAAQGRRLAEEIAASSVTVTGALTDLVAASVTEAADDRVSEPCGCEDLLAAAVDGLAGMAALDHDRLLLARERATEARGERDAARQEAAAAVEAFRAYREVPPSRRVKRCLVELAQDVPAMGHAYRGYSRLRRLRAGGPARPGDVMPASDQRQP